MACVQSIAKAVGQGKSHPPRPAPGLLLVLAAHPDDEVLGAGAWLARRPSPPVVAYLTDGAPLHPRWRAPGFRGSAAYARARRREARAAWRRLHPGARLFFAPFPDQQLAFRLAPAEAWLAALAARVAPASVLAPAFEGGHPDHDAANLLAARLGAACHIPVWEYALYTCCNGRMRHQCFPAAPRPARRLLPADAARKRRALAAFASQRDTLRALDAGREALRPLPPHDYRHRPRLEPAVYELWGFAVRAEQVAARFAAYLDRA
jgi:LmbE family N-acetylglucosaminyl deacetylase